MSSRVESESFTVWTVNDYDSTLDILKCQHKYADSKNRRNLIEQNLSFSLLLEATYTASFAAAQVALQGVKKTGLLLSKRTAPKSSSSF